MKKCWDQEQVFSSLQSPTKWVAERENRTIVKAAKAMLHDENLETLLCGEAFDTAVFIQNRCPHSRLKNETPEEAFTWKKLYLSI